MQEYYSENLKSPNVTPTHTWMHNIKMFATKMGREWFITFKRETSVNVTVELPVL